MATEHPPARRPYKGSCHCGFTKYIVYLELPPRAPRATKEVARAQKSIRIYKCNCTTCHKMGIFHLRVPFAPTDFFLLAPLDPESSLGDYTCSDGAIHFTFCKKCGVRCFAFTGEGEVVQREVEGEKRAVWALKEVGYVEGQGRYLTINAQTLEAGQEGLDLREWHEQGWICYLDCLDESEEARYGLPHRGGMY